MSVCVRVSMRHHHVEVRDKYSHLDLPMPSSAHLLDMVRGVVSCETVDDALEAFRVLCTHFEVLRVKNMFADEDSPYGFRQILINVRFAGSGCRRRSRRDGDVRGGGGGDGGAPGGGGGGDGGGGAADAAAAAAATAGVDVTAGSVEGVDNPLPTTTGRRADDDDDIDGDDHEEDGEGLPDGCGMVSEWGGGWRSMDIMWWLMRDDLVADW